MNERAGRVGELVCLSLDSFALWTADSHRATAAFAIVTKSLIAFLYGFIWAAICATSCFARIARVFFSNSWKSSGKILRDLYDLVGGRVPRSFAWFPCSPKEEI